MLVVGVKMQRVMSPSVDNLPKTGYYVSHDEKKEKFYQTESHIHKQNALSGIKAGAHKLTNDIFTYFPKGFQGSKNSDFYEFLSLGMVPYIAGSATMIALYSAVNNKFNAADAFSAGKVAKKMGAGVVLYGIGKLLSQKIAHKGIKASTGIDLDMLYINKVNEFPEPGQEKGVVRTQYPGVFSSVDFYRKDLLAKDSELNHGNIYAYDDKIARKAGFKEQLNAPNQTIGPKIREVKARTTAMENISKYIMAATGVALGSQKAFENIKFSNPFKNPKAIIKTIASIGTALKDGAVQLWKGTDKNALTKHGGKALVIASAASTLLTWLIPTIGFKTNPDTMKAKVDTNKEYEVG